MTGRAFVVLRAGWRRIVASGVGLAVLVGGYVLLKGRTYTGVSAFTVQSRRPPSVAGIASQLGIALPANDASQSPQFYAEFLLSRQVLGATADTPFPDSLGRMVSLASLLGIEDDSAKAREQTIAELVGRVAARASTRTGVVRVSVRMGSPSLARAVNQRLLDLLDAFNREVRQSQASAERRFTEGRLAESRQELRAAEDELQEFLQRNRDYRRSPPLSFQAERLERAVATRQRVVETLAEAHEQARIEEVRDTPTITVVEQVEVPARPDARGLLPLLVLAMAAGAVLGGAGLLGLEWFRSPGVGRPE